MIDQHLLVILTGPSGAGKTTIAQGVIKLHPHLIGKVVTTTTRIQRLTEIQGVDYDFMSARDFTIRVSNGEFLEHKQHYGHRYGTRRLRVAEVFKHRRVALVCLDPTGALNLPVRLETPTLSIFIETAQPTDLIKRLTNRGDDPRKAKGRVRVAAEEMKLANRFDCRIVNQDGQWERATLETASIILNRLNKLPA